MAGKNFFKKLHTLRRLNWKRFFRYYKKRTRLQVDYFFSKLKNRKFWTVTIDGATCKMGFFHPYHHLMAKNLHYGRAEMMQLSLWKRQSEKFTNGLIFDFGSYNGIYGLIAAIANSQAQIEIFEPDPINTAHIESNLCLNNIKNATVRQMAISDRSGTLCFTQAQGQTSGHISDNPNNPQNNQSITAKTINECLADHFELPILMKFDICGAERSALLAAKETLAQIKNISILLEYYFPRHHRENTEENKQFWKKMREAGFQSIFLYPRGDGLSEYYFLFKE